MFDGSTAGLSLGLRLMMLDGDPQVLEGIVALLSARTHETLVGQMSGVPPESCRGRRRPRGPDHRG